MERFGTLREIDLVSPQTYLGRAFLTFDIDWAHDEVLADVVNLVEKADVAATWFVTHQTNLLERIRENPKFEVGIHPNFNFLLNGQGNKRTASDIVEELMGIVPLAKSVRSHSVAQSGPIQSIFLKNNLLYDSNDPIPYNAGIKLKPWKTASGLIKVPYCWADEHNWGMKADFERIIEEVSLAVFDFHPIHVFLNTDRPELYSQARDFLKDPEVLVTLRTSSEFGTRQHLKNLLNTAHI